MYTAKPIARRMVEALLCRFRQDINRSKDHPDTVTQLLLWGHFLDIGSSNLGSYEKKIVRVWNVGKGPLLDDHV